MSIKIFCLVAVSFRSLPPNLRRISPWICAGRQSAAPAIEFKTEGFILGVGAKMFTIAGPVIVYGVSASVVYGIIYWITTLF